MHSQQPLVQYFQQEDDIDFLLEKLEVEMTSPWEVMR